MRVQAHSHFLGLVPGDIAEVDGRLADVQAGIAGGHLVEVSADAEPDVGGSDLGKLDVGAAGDDDTAGQARRKAR